MSGYAPEIGPDGRPRPRYGEYATPEEQRARIAQPEHEHVEVAVPVAAPASGWATPASAWSPPHNAAAQAPARRRTADRIVTFALLAYGLVSVATQIPAFIDYVGFADTFLSALGVDARLADPAGARTWGIAAAIVLGIGWLATAALSLLSLRRGRLTWWIPLVGGIVFNFASAFFMLMPLLSDATVWAEVQAALLGG